MRPRLAALLRWLADRLDGLAQRLSPPLPSDPEELGRLMGEQFRTSLMSVQRFSKGFVEALHEEGQE
jgi:hypothetical protein